jgi:hypothetical protein
MGFLDKLLGREEPQQPGAGQNRYGAQPHSTQPLGASTWSRSAGQAPRQPSDEQALARYRYMLQTAPPEAWSKRMRKRSPN